MEGGGLLQSGGDVLLLLLITKYLKNILSSKILNDHTRDNQPRDSSKRTTQRYGIHQTPDLTAILSQMKFSSSLHISSLHW